MQATNNSSKEVTATCGYNCVYFYGTNPSSTKGAPPAWCNPPGSCMAHPCLPGEDASKKPCFKASVSIH